jgi:hypothetical protein
MLVLKPGTLCKLCRRRRPYHEFVWRDDSGKEGVSGRCVACRNRGTKSDPALPRLRHHITGHALKRYLERVRPDLMDLPFQRARKLAYTEMRWRMAYAEWEREWPEWIGGRRAHADESVGFLRLDDNTIFVLSAEPSGERVVVTVLTRELAPSAPAAEWEEGAGAT